MSLPLFYFLTNTNSNFMKLRSTLLSLLCLSSLPMAAQTKLTDADLSGAYTTKTPSRISVHDPSIFIEHSTETSSDPTYYIYGSHRAGGYTKGSQNYQKWTSRTLSNSYTTNATKTVKNCNGATVTFGNFNANDWQYKGYSISGNEWAPDIIWNKTMQKYCMYMSVNGNKWCSSIVLLTSTSPSGPWTYQGPVVFSGFQGTYEHNGFAATNDYKHTDLEIALGTLSSLPSRYRQGGSWGSYWPNCIDPCVFYDDNDKLWLSYGSWSGGIFMFELDETTGLRDYTVKYTSKFSSGSDYRNCIEDPYYGKKIAGGWYNSGEASYIQKIGKYYYLFMSYGGLKGYGDYFDVGYQIRVFRSENPDGPYVDCLTTAGRKATFTSAFTDFGSNTQTDYGVRLMSCYKWDTMPYAEIAQGHNSAFVDHKGRAFVVYHTRQNNGNEGHSVRVHQLFQNQDGWLVASPFEFAGEETTQDDIDTRQLCSAADVAGDYQFIFHKYRQDASKQEYEVPVNVKLNADGTVSGTYKGTWSLVPGTSYINITLNGSHTTNKNLKLNGVVTRQTVDYTNIPAVCISVLSSSDGVTSSSAGAAYPQTRGMCVWGVKADAKAAIKYTLDKSMIPFSNGSTIAKSVTLPAGLMGAKITWTSSDENVMTSAGRVKGKGNVTMTMNIEKDGYAYTKTYTLNVDADAVPIYYPVCGATNYSTAFMGAWSDSYSINKGESIEFKFYNYTNKAALYKNWVLFGYNGSTEIFSIRADRWDNKGGSADNFITCDLNFDTFSNDAHQALVDIICEYAEDGTFTQSVTMTTTTGNVYHEVYRKSFSSATLTLKFTVENSYISNIGPNGEDLTTGILPVHIARPASYDNVIRNISGQRVGSSYKGMVIKNGKKYISK